jgi:surface protein
MKKLFLFFALLAGIAVMTGCKKDQDGITLKAVFDQETKAYFGNSDRDLPYWDSDDQVNVNGTSYGLDAGSVSTTFASITGVTPSSVYCAIYPANALVPESMTPSVTRSTATIKFDNHQQYVSGNNGQRVNMPMGAVTTDNDKTLIFKNLCSILRLNVSNNLSTDFCVKRITVTSFGGYISGYFDVNLSYNNSTHQTDVPGINPSSLNSNSEDNTLTLHVPNKTIASGASEPFDIVVPPFNARYLILEAELYRTNGTKIGYTSDTVAIVPDTWVRTAHNSILDAINGTVSVARNKIVTINFGVTSVTDDVIPFDYGYLEPGPDFNQHMKQLIGTRTDIKQIMFLNGAVNAQPLINAGFIDNQGNIVDPTPRNGWVDVSTSDSPHKIYAHIEGTIVKIYSWADFIYANTNCNNMFRDLTTIEGIQWTTSRDRGFQSEDVNSMAYMFAGCTHLKTLVSYNSYDPNGTVIADPDGKFYLNTTNVTNMEHMFDGCIALNNLYLDFNTHNVIGDGMVAMFKDCSALASLNISSFTTERITNMTDLFNGCKVMKTLRLDNFNMNNVSNENKKDMFKETASIPPISVNDPCQVYCPATSTNNVVAAILAQDGNGIYDSGLDATNPGGNYYPTGYTNARKIVFNPPSK